MHYCPPLNVTERAGRVRLDLDRVTHGEGASLQEAADDLVRRLLGIVMAFRSSGFTASRVFPPDFKTLDFLYELGELAAAGADIRARVFG